MSVMFLLSLFVNNFLSNINLQIYTGGHRARNARSELNILHHSSEGLSTPQQ